MTNRATIAAHRDNEAEEFRRAHGTARGVGDSLRDVRSDEPMPRGLVERGEANLSPVRDDRERA